MKQLLIAITTRLSRCPFEVERMQLTPHSDCLMLSMGIWLEAPRRYQYVFVEFSQTVLEQEHPEGFVEGKIRELEEATALSPPAGAEIQAPVLKPFRLQEALELQEVTISEQEFLVRQAKLLMAARIRSGLKEPYIRIQEMDIPMSPALRAHMEAQAELLEKEALTFQAWGIGGGNG